MDVLASCSQRDHLRPMLFADDLALSEESMLEAEMERSIIRTGTTNRKKEDRTQDKIR